MCGPDCFVSVFVSVYNNLAYINHEFHELRSLTKNLYRLEELKQNIVDEKAKDLAKYLDDLNGKETRIVEQERQKMEMVEKIKVRKIYFVDMVTIVPFKRKKSANLRNYVRRIRS